jgi:hypothetical protein
LNKAQERRAASRGAGGTAGGPVTKAGPAAKGDTLEAAGPKRRRREGP